MSVATNILFGAKHNYLGFIHSYYAYEFPLPFPLASASWLGSYILSCTTMCIIVGSKCIL